MDLEPKKPYRPKRKNYLVLSVLFFVFSLLATAGLYFYNMNLVNNNKILDDEINLKEASIKELERDSKVLIFRLYKSNIKSIQKLNDYSNINLFIDHIMKISRIYSINFKWFNYSSWKLSLSATASSDSSGKLHYQKISEFISKYRENQNLESLFDLSLIKNISTKNEGVDNVFSIELDLKDNLEKILQDIETKKLEDQEMLRLEQEKRKQEFEKKKQDILNQN